MADTSKSTAAGILDIAAGVSALAGSLVTATIALIAGGLIGAAVEPEMEAVALLPAALLVPVAVFFLTAGVVAVAGGVAAVRRSSWGWTIAGAVAALVCFLPLGVAAVVLTILAEPEFRST
jgi:hypothetical protein